MDGNGVVAASDLRSWFVEQGPMREISQRRAIAVLGGTFDPVHHGHLRLAMELAEQLDLTQVQLMPGYQPVHRDRPSATAEQRLSMLQLAVAENGHLQVDDRELQRKGPSYSLLSLQELRTEVGEDTQLFFILGEDAFSKFDSWYRWQEIIEYANILIATRPGEHPKLSNELSHFVEKHRYQGEGYPDSVAGSVVRVDNLMLEIASSDIRQRITDGRNINYLLPSGVQNYIEQQNLYR